MMTRESAVLLGGASVLEVAEGGWVGGVPYRDYLSKVANIAAIAKAEKVNNTYVSRMVSLTTLAPDIRVAILDETLPDSVSLFDLAVETPLSWEEQPGRVEQAFPSIS